MRKIKYKGKTPFDMKEGKPWNWRLVSYTKQKLSAVCLVLLLLQGDGGGLLHVLIQLGDSAAASMC